MGNLLALIVCAYPNIFNTMNIPYLVGMPKFLPLGQTEFDIPVSQIQNIPPILQTSAGPSTILNNLRSEFVDIVGRLQEMELNFSIAAMPIDHLDIEMLALCKSAGCKVSGFSDTFPQALVGYPRDLSMSLPNKTLLVNPSFRITTPERNGWKLVNSPFGEGGRMLYRNNCAVVVERLGDDTKVKTTQKTLEGELKILRESGAQVIISPNPANGVIKNGKLKDECFASDHIDRTSCLVEDTRGRLHLIVDHDIATCHTLTSSPFTWSIVGAGPTLSKLHSQCHRLGVTVHRAPPSSIPYTLNLLQTPDGRIMMTAGADKVREMLQSITGQSITTTKKPIRYFPVWKYAGIRCLVGEMPIALFSSFFQ